MPEPNDALTLQLLEWLSSGPRPYAEVMEVWRTSCPRLSIWEDALEAGLVRVEDSDVVLTEQGKSMLTVDRQDRQGSC